MDGEVVHSLLALLDEGVAVDFPCQVFYLAVHLLQCLVDGHGAHRYRTVAHNPFACLVDVGTRRQVHQRVAAPFAAPHGLVHFLVDARRGGRVADVGIDFHQEVATDDHRFRFRVVDVGWQHGTSGGNLVAHELRRDVGVDAQLLAVHVLADGYVLHFRGDDALFGVVHLRAAVAFLGAVGQGDVLKAQVVERVVIAAHLAVFRGDGRQLFHVAAGSNPALAHARQSFLQVNLDVRVAERAAGVVHVHRVVGSHYLLSVDYGHRGGEVHFLHAYLDEGE